MDVSLRFLGNENFPLASCRMLETNGFATESITRGRTGISDVEVLRDVATAGQVILTFDRDYGELIFRLRLNPPAGIVYFRFHPQDPEEPGRLLLELLTNGLALTGRFTTVERDRVRQRLLKPIG